MSRKQRLHPYPLFLTMRQPSEKQKIMSALHTVITEDKDGGVTRRKVEENSGSAIFSFLPTSENEKSVLTIRCPGVVPIIFG